MSSPTFRERFPTMSLTTRLVLEPLEDRQMLTRIATLGSVEGSGKVNPPPPPPPYPSMILPAPIVGLLTPMGPMTNQPPGNLPPNGEMLPPGEGTGYADGGLVMAAEVPQAALPTNSPAV